MFRIFLIASLFIASTAFADVSFDESYSLCQETDYDHMSTTEIYLRREINHAIGKSVDKSYVEFWSSWENRNYRLQKPLKTPELSWRQIAQQQYRMCLKVSSEPHLGCYTKAFNAWIESSACAGSSVCANQQAQLACLSPEGRKLLACQQESLLRFGDIRQEFMQPCLAR